MSYTCDIVMEQQINRASAKLRLWKQRLTKTIYFILLNIYIYFSKKKL